MVRHTLTSLGPKVLATRMVHDYVHNLYAPAAESSKRVSANDYAPARKLAQWRRRVLDAWPGVRVLYVDSQMAGDATLGSHLTLRAEVALNGLSPDDVCVEAVYGAVDLDDRLTDSTAVALKVADPSDGTVWFEGSVPLERTGPFGYTVRVLPHDDLLASAAELGVVATA
jgi:starch phosphorylase